MTNTEKIETKFLDDLRSKTSSPRTIASCYICIKDPASFKDPGSLETLLSLDESNLSSVAKESLTVLENEEVFNNHWVDFKWKLISYLNVQDTFSATIYDGGDSNIIFRQPGHHTDFSINKTTFTYCYYIEENAMDVPS